VRPSFSNMAARLSKPILFEEAFALELVDFADGLIGCLCDKVGLAHDVSRLGGGRLWLGAPPRQLHLIGEPPPRSTLPRRIIEIP
jgi:hypothetical protein